MEQFLEAVQAAAARIIGEQRYVAHPDDVDDIFILEDSLDLLEFADIETAIANSSQARRAVGLSAGDPVPPGYAVGFMRRWQPAPHEADGIAQRRRMPPAESPTARRAWELLAMAVSMSANSAGQDCPQG